MKYDIIGDIHGHGTQLIELLKHLGYKKRDGIFTHPEKKVVFLGDFIDRGENLKEHTLVLKTVMDMFYNNSAYAIMGNHEFNALSFHTKINNEPLRKHTEKNIKQHQAFLNEFNDENKEPILNFFFDLPLFLEFDNFRVIHACWDKQYIKQARTKLENNKINKDFLIKANEENSLEYQIIERLLKGFEYELPDNLSVKCSDGNMRSSLRIKWWEEDFRTLNDISFDSIEKEIKLNNFNNIGYPEKDKPLFVGHYWFKGIPKLIKDNMACLDYSVAKKGKLVAYTFDEKEPVLKNKNFRWNQKKVLHNVAY